MNNNNYDVYDISQREDSFTIVRTRYENDQFRESEDFLEDIFSWDDAVRELDEIAGISRTDEGREVRYTNDGTIRVYDAPPSDDE